MKKLVALVLTLVLALSCAAMAETAVMLWEADSIRQLHYASSVLLVEMDDQGYGTATIAGEIKIPLEHERLAGVQEAVGYAISTAEIDDIHTKSLIAPDGTVLTTERYIDIEVFSEKWFIGVAVAPTTEEEYDYYTLLGTERYLIDHVDVYYAPTGKIASLDRTQYLKAKAFGDHLLVLNRDRALQLYDSQFNPVESTFKSFYDGEYECITKGLTRAVVSRVTGETVATGYDQVASTEFNGKVLAVHSASARGWGLIDLEGNVIVPCAEGVTFVGLGSSDYCRFYMSDNYDLYGVYDLTTGQQIVPCMYEDVFYQGNLSCFNGYFSVEKGGMLGFVDLNGVETVAPTYAKDTTTILGASMMNVVDGVYTLIAADGTVTVLDGVTDFGKYDYESQGRYFSVQNADGMWGVMDWHGNMLVDYTAKYNSFEFIDATHFIYNGSYLYEIQ